MNVALGADLRILSDRPADPSSSTRHTASEHAARPVSPGPSPPRKGRILRYVADRRPVAFASGLLALHLVAFFLAPAWLAVCLVVPFSVLNMFVSPLNHHHQHFNTFHSAVLNRIYEVVLSLQTGISPYAWVLHHNLGHHRNYLNQRPHAQPDESKWTRRDGSTMGRVEYTIDLVLHHQIDIFRVGRRHPRHWRSFLLMKVPVWGILAVLLYLNPLNALLVFLLPGFVALAHTAWATYEHHAGFHPTDHYDASVNRVDPLYNLLTCNLGYHTAHHLRPGVHWSLLPKIHAEIEHQIPEAMILRTFW
jgi:fatty acid desaturase